MIYYNVFETFEEFVKHFRTSQKYQNRSVIPNKGMAIEPKSVSLCTTCMNRLHDIKETLRKNIEDNEDYLPLEFVLLDYHSSDGLGEWIKSEMMDHIESGRLVYYRTTQPQHFCPNHSRNVSFKLASNEIVGNVDSDNFTHKDYAKRLNECASIANEKVIILPENFLLPDGNRNLLKGRFALYKKDIELLRGFDEELDQGFSNDDMNFVLRAMISNFKIARFESIFTEDRLFTSNENRGLYTKNKNLNETYKINSCITQMRLARCTMAVNPKGWGKCVLVKNFSEVVET